MLATANNAFAKLSHGEQRAHLLWANKRYARDTFNLNEKQVNSNSSFSMSNILGANYRTTLAGAITAALQAYVNGAFSDPSDWHKWLVPVALAAFGYLAKSKEVTGGTVPNDPPALSPAQAKKVQDQ